MRIADIQHIVFLQMKGRYFQLYNLVDWMVYLLAIVFVFDLCIDYKFGLGCRGPKVESRATEMSAFVTSVIFSAGSGLLDHFW